MYIKESKINIFYFDSPNDLTGVIFGNFCPADKSNLSKDDIQCIPLVKLQDLTVNPYGTNRKLIMDYSGTLLDNDDAAKITSIINSGNVIENGIYFTDYQICKKFYDKCNKLVSVDARVDVDSSFTKDFKLVLVFSGTLDGKPRLFLPSTFENVLGTYIHEKVSMDQFVHNREDEFLTKYSINPDMELIDLCTGISNSELLKRINYGLMFTPNLVSNGLSSTATDKDVLRILADIDKSYLGFKRIRNQLSSTTFRPNISMLDDIELYANLFNISVNKFDVIQSLVIMEFIGDKFVPTQVNNAPATKAYNMVTLLQEIGGISQSITGSGSISNLEGDFIVNNGEVTLTVRCNDKSALINFKTSAKDKLRLTVSPSLGVAAVFMQSLSSAIGLCKDAARKSFIQRNTIVNLRELRHNSGSLRSIASLTFRSLCDLANVSN